MANWIGRILRKNCLVEHIIQGKIEERIVVTRRKGRRHKQLLDALKETRECWKLKGKAVDFSLSRTRFGRLRSK